MSVGLTPFEVGRALRRTAAALGDIQNQPRAELTAHPSAECVSLKISRLHRPHFMLIFLSMFRRDTIVPALLVCALTVLPCLHAASEPPAPGKNFTVENPAIPMVWIAPGTFLLSSTHSAGDDTQVTLARGYWLGQTEVTQGQWQAVIDRIPIPSRFKGSDRPVEQVSWDLVMEFCLVLTERERAAGRLPEGYRYTLPTEAQWEYACRAGTTGSYAGEVAVMAWYDTNSGGETHPVAQKQPNAWGLHDMHGNVQEWCADWHQSYPGGSVSDPAGPASGQFHVVRGGGWNYPAGLCRSAFRSLFPTASSASLGFRLALAPQRPAPAEVKPAGHQPGSE